MEFRPVKYFDMGDNAPLSLVRFYLSLKVKLGISYSKSNSKCFRFCL